MEGNGEGASSPTDASADDEPGPIDDEVRNAVATAVETILATMSTADLGSATPTMVGDRIEARVATTGLPDAVVLAARRSVDAETVASPATPGLVGSIAGPFAETSIGDLATVVGSLALLLGAAGYLVVGDGSFVVKAFVALMAGLALLAVVLQVVGAWIVGSAERTARLALSHLATLAAGADLRSTVRSALVEPALESLSQVTLAPLEVDTVTSTETPGLSSRTLVADRLTTRSHRLVYGHIARTGGATVGLAGERGAGKSELIRSFCDPDALTELLDEDSTVSVMVPAPTTYGGLDFLRVLALRLCEATPGYERESQAMAPPPPQGDRWPWLGLALLAAGAYAATRADVRLSRVTTGQLGWALVLAGAALVVPGALRWSGWRRIAERSGPLDFIVGSPRPALRSTPPDAARHAAALGRRLRYAQTLTTSAGAQLTLGVLEVSGSRETGLEALPVTEPELIAEIARLAKSLAANGYRVIVGIDELDKLDSSDQAPAFLNSIKGLFPIRDCSFLISISESAYVSFVGRGLPIRDVFDSSLDAVVQVEPLDLFEAQRLIARRREDLSTTQVLACYWLSGGLPRELLRAARRLGEVNQALDGPRPLVEVLDRLLAEDLAEQGHRVELEARQLADGELRRHLLTVAEAARTSTPVAFLASTAAPVALPLAAGEVERERAARVVDQLVVVAYLMSTVRDLLDSPTFRMGFQDAPIKDLATAARPLADARRSIELDVGLAWGRIDAVRRTWQLLLVEQPGS